MGSRHPEAQLTGSYTASGFQLSPDHWISKPQDYSMVGLTGGAPGSNDTVLSGSIVSPGCTTFGVPVGRGSGAQRHRAVTADRMTGPTPEPASASSRQMPRKVGRPASARCRRPGS